MPAPRTVREFMSTEVATVGPEATGRAVAERLYGEEIGSLLVTDGDRLLGIVTESDLTRLVAAGDDPATTRVQDAMTTDPVTIDPDEHVQTAAQRLADGGFRRLPVTEDGMLVGILTASDLADVLPEVWDSHATHRLVGRADTHYETPDWTFEGEGSGTLEVGDRVRFHKTLTEADVREFAHASGDTNRLHLDESFAAKTRFGRRIVHGTLVGGVISGALARLPGLTIYLSQELGYYGPVDLGERVTSTCEVVEDLGDDRYRLTTSVDDADGERVIEGEATVLVDDLPGDLETAAP